jgi:hypothetical protein
MATYTEQLQHIFERYRDEVSPDPVDLRTVASWAIDQSLWKPRIVELSAVLANDLAGALREKKRTDKDGREHRAFIPVRTKAGNGQDLFEWADIDTAPRAHVEKHVQQDRRSIVSDCYALQMKVDHYNAVHPEEDPIQLVLNFTDDVEEEKIARGLDKAS